MITSLLLLATAPATVLCISDNPSNYAELTQALAPAYSVTGLTSSSFSFLGALPSPGAFTNVKASIAVVSLGSLDATPELMAKRDRLVPTVQGYIATLRRLPSHPKVYLVLPPATNSVIASSVRPLLVQAAREANVPLIRVEEAASWVEEVRDAIQDPRAAKAGWNLVATDSEQIDEGPARMAIDGDPNTYWHTQYSPTEPKPPHWIVVDCGEVLHINGFRYVPRQDGGVNGRVKGYTFEVSLDGKSWGEPVAKGTFASTSEPTRVKWTKPVEGRYFRFTALSEAENGPWASAAEIDVLRALP